MLLNEDVLNEQVNEMTGLGNFYGNSSSTQQTAPHPLLTPATVEPKHPEAPHLEAKLGEGQKRQTAHVLGWCLLFGKVKISVRSCKFRSGLGSNRMGLAECFGVRG